MLKPVRLALVALSFTATTAVAAEVASPPDMAAFDHAHISLLEAISAAEKKDPNSPIMTIAFATGENGPHYNVTLLRGDDLEQLTVDAMSGDAMISSRQVALSESNRQMQAEVAALKSSKTTVADAATAAEKTHGGKTMWAGLHDHEAGVTLDAALVRPKGNLVVSYDPVSGVELSPRTAE